MCKTIFPAPISHSFSSSLITFKAPQALPLVGKMPSRKIGPLEAGGKEGATRRRGGENKPRMIITTDPRPPARLAPPRPPGSPAGKVPTGRRAAPDENIHDGVCLKARRLPSIRLNTPGRRSQQRNKVKASGPLQKPNRAATNEPSRDVH